jgi:hypothetical protein
VEDVDRTKRTIVHKINTDSIDRYNTVILPRGGRFENYRNNPTVFWNHSGNDLPIAKNLDIKVYDRKIIARTQFLPNKANDWADMIFDMYADGFLNAWSVSIDPIETSMPLPDEIRKRPDWAGARCIYRTWDLLEYSIVTIPGNAEVCRNAISRGYKLPGWDLAPEPAPAPPATSPAAGLPPLVGRSLDQVVESVTRGLFGDSESLRRSLFSDALDLAKGKV